MGGEGVSTYVKTRCYCSCNKWFAMELLESLLCWSRSYNL
jgi:hypothetical protein